MLLPSAGWTLLHEVGVDGNPRAVTALVIVEPGPRLVRDDLVDDGLAVGQRVVGADPVAQRAGERLDALAKPLRWDFVRGPVGLHAGGQRARAPECRVEPGVSLAVTLGLTPADAHVEVVVNLV